MTGGRGCSVCARVHVSKHARVCACIRACVQCFLDIKNPDRRTEKSVLMSFSAHRIIPCSIFFFFSSIHPLFLPPSFSFWLCDLWEEGEHGGSGPCHESLDHMTEEEIK